MNDNTKDTKIINNLEEKYDNISGKIENAIMANKIKKIIFGKNKTENPKLKWKHNLFINLFIKIYIVYNFLINLGNLINFFEKLFKWYLLLKDILKDILK